MDTTRKPINARQPAANDPVVDPVECPADDRMTFGEILRDAAKRGFIGCTIEITGPMVRKPTPPPKTPTK
jgi:hypothetical protein